MSVHIIAGGQYGSEGKGAFAAALVQRLSGENPLALVRVAGPNAGHTAYHQGNKWSLRQIPVGAVIDHEAPVYIGPQSEIDPEVLLHEIEQLEQEGYPIIDRLMIDGNATLIHQSDKESETRIGTGTTGKGVGGARASRIMRMSLRVRDEQGSMPWVRIGDVTKELRRAMHDREIVLEGTQGYGLGSHTDYYPHTTSSNCRAGDFLAMTGIQPWEIDHVTPWVVFRPHPIRIAGESGPLYRETNWEEIDQPVEYTTVTQKPRRVGQWDQVLARSAIEANGGSDRIRIALNFADYLFPDIKGVSIDDHYNVRSVLRVFVPNRLPHIDYIGTGPDTGIWDPQQTRLDI